MSDAKALPPICDELIRAAAAVYIVADKEVADSIADTIRRAVACISETTNAPLELQMRTAEALDAERYRYLRNAAGQYLGEEDGPAVCSGLSDLFGYHFGPEVDEVVDAAIERWKAAGSPLPKEAK